MSRIASPLHRDGSVILKVEPEDLVRPLSSKRSAARSHLGRPQEDDSDADALWIDAIPQNSKISTSSSAIGIPVIPRFPAAAIVKIRALRTIWHANLIIIFPTDSSPLHETRRSSSSSKQANDAIPLILAFKYQLRRVRSAHPSRSRMGALFAMAWLKAFASLADSLLKSGGGSPSISCKAPACGHQDRFHLLSGLRPDPFRFAGDSRRIRRRRPIFPASRSPSWAASSTARAKWPTPISAMSARSRERSILYVGKTCVERDIEFADADQKLIELIKAHGKWEDSNQCILISTLNHVYQSISLDTQTTMGKYDPRAIEKKWQKIWKEKKIFKAEIDPKKPKYYILDMFPYPSGAGLHVGHVTGYTGTDILARYKRQKGFNVLHPMGWDSFGLPAEQYAIRTGTHPAITTQDNIDTYRRQLKSLGFSYDWDREIATSDPTYYKWTQWIFTKLFEKGLAYEAEVNVNFCPALGTVLANEEVENGKSKEGGYPVERRPLETMDPPDHRLCRSAARRSRSARLARSFKKTASQLDRPKRRGHDLFCRRDDTTNRSSFSRPGPTLFLARPFWSCAGTSARRPRSPRTDQREAVEKYRDADGCEKRSGADRSRQRKNRRLDRRLCHPSDHGRKDPDLDRRLCANGIWHRRCDGRACA